MQELLKTLVNNNPSLTTYAPFIFLIVLLVTVFWKPINEELVKKGTELFIKLLGETIGSLNTQRKLRKYCNGIISKWDKPNQDLPELISLTLIQRQESDGLDGRKSPEEAITIEQLLEPQSSSLLLIGAPGCGKTTLLKRLNYELSRRYVDGPGKHVPLFLELGSYHKSKSPTEWVDERLNHKVEISHKLMSKKSPRIFFLLDGFNEIQGGTDQETIQKWRDFLQELEGEGRHRAILSWRDREYDRELGTRDLVSIKDLTFDQITDFVRKNIPHHQQRLIEDLTKLDRERSTSFSSIFSTPYFLMMLRTICKSEEYPEDLINNNTALLFSAFFRRVLADEHKESKISELFDDKEDLFSVDEVKQIRTGLWPTDDKYYLPERGTLFTKLRELALQMQEKATLEWDSVTFPQKLVDGGYRLHILTEIIENSKIKFRHQLIQEYFAARQFVFDPQPEKCAIVRQETFNARWDEVVLMALTMMRPESQAVFLRDLVRYNPILVVRAIEMVPGIAADSIKDLVRKELLGWMEEPSHVTVRARAGEALGVIGDPRFELRRTRSRFGDYQVIEPELVEIEAGEYPVGDNNQMVRIEPFRIGKYHITNAEYRCFIEAGGYEDERWWDTAESLIWFRGEGPKLIEGTFWEGLRSLFPSDRDYRQPLFLQDRRFNNASQPVVGICWFEARAYCNWLSHATGNTYRLPTEVEYEVAARGREGRQYSASVEFDPQLYNTRESGLGRPTVGGVFKNQTPEGAIDLTGNVWIWTSTRYESQFPPDEDDDRESPLGNVARLVRGGSWDYFQGSARAAYRDYAHPAFRYNYFGVRVVFGLRPPSLNH